MRAGPSPSSAVSGWSLNPEAFGCTWSHTSTLLLTLLSLKVRADIGSATEPGGPHATEKSQLNEKKHGRPWPRFFWGLTGAKHSWGRRFKWAAERAASNGGRWSTAGSSPCAQKTMCQQDNSCSLSLCWCLKSMCLATVFLDVGSALQMWDFWATAGKLKQSTYLQVFQ